jgi:hypothetical protein
LDNGLSDYNLGDRQDQQHGQFQPAADPVALIWMRELGQSLYERGLKFRQLIAARYKPAPRSRQFTYVAGRGPSMRCYFRVFEVCRHPVPPLQPCLFLTSVCASRIATQFRQFISALTISSGVSSADMV